MTCQCWWGPWVVGAALALGACASKPGAEPSRSPALSEEPGNRGDPRAVEQLLDTGKGLMRTREPERAARELRRASELAAALSPPSPELHADALGELASCLVVLKRSNEARQLVVQALPLVERATPRGQVREFRLNMTLAESFRYEKRPELAVAPFRAAIAALGGADTRPELASDHTEAASRLATTLIQLGRDQEAELLLEQALVVARRSPRPGEDARLATQLALILMRRNELERVGELGARGRRLQVATMTYSDVPRSELLAAPASPAPQGPSAAPPVPSRSGTVADAAREVAKMRAGFRACYQAALRNDPQLQGSVRITMRVADDGRVSELKALVVGLATEAVDCILERASEGQFLPPDGGSAVIVVPVTFGLTR